MSRLIIHIGPPKCASSTIQSLFLDRSNLNQDHVAYIMLDPALILKLNAPNIEQEDEEMMRGIVQQHNNRSELLILSHEFLFQTPQALSHICHIAKNIMSSIAIVGYSRRQSSFIVSAYGQWLFRSSERVKEVDATLKLHNIETLLFTGVEKLLIASIYDDFYACRQLTNYEMLNWNKSYANIAQRLDADTELKVGLLPNKNYKCNLLEDFCQKAKINVQNTFQTLCIEQENKSFDATLIESIQCAVENDLETIGPHEANLSLQNLSQDINNKPTTSDFMQEMATYVDSYFYDDNMQFCSKYNLEPSYFSIEKKVSKEEIISIIKNEEKKRADNPLEFIAYYKNLVAHMAKLSVDMQLRVDMP